MEVAEVTSCMYGAGEFKIGNFEYQKIKLQVT
jgi:hypothetical protein